MGKERTDRPTEGLANRQIALNEPCVPRLLLSNVLCVPIVPFSDCKRRFASQSTAEGQRRTGLFSRSVACRSTLSVGVSTLTASKLFKRRLWRLYHDGFTRSYGAEAGFERTGRTTTTNRQLMSPLRQWRVHRCDVVYIKQIGINLRDRLLRLMVHRSVSVRLYQPPRAP